MWKSRESIVFDDVKVIKRCMLSMRLLGYTQHKKSSGHCHIFYRHIDMGSAFHAGNELYPATINPYRLRDDLAEIFCQRIPIVAQWRDFCDQHRRRWAPRRTRHILRRNRHNCVVISANAKSFHALIPCTRTIIGHVIYPIDNAVP